MAVIKTQGTQLWAYEPETNTLTGPICATAIGGASSPKAQIDTTTLCDTESRTFVAGLSSPGTSDFTIQFDPQNVQHMQLHQYYLDGTDLTFVIGLSDGTVAPTAGSAAGDPVTLPTARTFVTFDGYLTDFPLPFDLDDVLRVAIGIQVSGSVNIEPKTPE